MINLDYSEYLLNEASSDIAAIHQFIILNREGGEEIHLFFEGEDDGLYYTPEVRRRAGSRKIHQYDCGGKSNVVAVRDFIKNDEYNCLCLYFVDRDFDDLLGTQIPADEHTYITDGYAIENSLCSLDSAEIALQDLIKITHADTDYLPLKHQIDSAFISFYKACRPLTSWVLAAKEEGFSPNLRNTKGLSRVLTVRKDGTSFIGGEGFKYFRRQVISNGHSPSIHSTIRWRRRLHLAQAERWTRGKYVYWFFHVAIVNIVSDINPSRAARGLKKLRIPASFRDGRLFECMSGRVVPPRSLSSFLDSHLH